MSDQFYPPIPYSMRRLRSTRRTALKTRNQRERNKLAAKIHRARQRYLMTMSLIIGSRKAKPGSISDREMNAHRQELRAKVYETYPPREEYPRKITGA